VVNFTNILLAHLRQKNLKTKITKKLRAKLSYEKGARKMLVKLTPTGTWAEISIIGVNFLQIIQSV
jgi:hypothetical protein